MSNEYDRRAGNTLKFHTEEGNVLDLLDEGAGAGITIEPQLAQKITVVGSDTYIATALPGTAQSAASWRVKKVTVSGGDTVVAWADGNTAFDNVATDLTALSYS